jgi:DNA-binding HxlR family transcriptional regulator
MRASARRFSRELACMIHLEEGTYCVDPAGGIMDLLGKRWSLPLIGVLGNRDASRFNELLEALEGIGSKILADRLQAMVREGLVERHVYPDTPVRVEYRLTPRGVDLRRALVPLLVWASRPSEEGSPDPRGGIPTPSSSSSKLVSRWRTPPQA